MSWLTTRFSRFLQVMEAKVHIPWALVNGCCQVEIHSVSASTYDWQRLGVEEASIHPCQSDLLIVGGWINAEFKKEIELAYSQLAGRKSVVVVGACAISGSPYKFGNTTAILAQDFLPVDVFVPGCPPRPEAILDAVRMLKAKICPGPDQKAVLIDAIKEASR